MLVGACSFLLAVAIPQGLIELARSGVLPAPLATDVAGTPAWKLVAAGALVLFGAVGVGGILGAARKWLFRLAPPDEQGACFGVYGLTNKLSLIALLAFSVLADLRGDYRYSVTFLVVELAIASPTM